jgi:hypothetical protein
MELNLKITVDDGELKNLLAATLTPTATFSNITLSQPAEDIAGALAEHVAKGSIVVTEATADTSVASTSVASADTTDTAVPDATANADTSCATDTSVANTDTVSSDTDEDSANSSAAAASTPTTAAQA